MISQYSKLAKIEPIADLGFDFFAKAAQYKSEKIQQNFGALQSTLSGFVNNVDIVKEDERQYFNEKVKGVVDNLNNFKDLDLSNPNTSYQLQSMLGEVKTDSKISSAIVDSSYFRNIQKQRDLMKTNPKFFDLYDPDLEKYDNNLMQEWINTPGGRLKIQNASVNPKMDKQLQAAYDGVKEKQIASIEGDLEIHRVVKEKNQLYNSGNEVANKNAAYLGKKYEVNYDFKNNAKTASTNVSNLLKSHLDYYTNELIEIKQTANASNNSNRYTDIIKSYETEISTIKNNIDLANKGEDIESIKKIGFNAYVRDVAVDQSRKGYSYIKDLNLSDATKIRKEFEKMGFEMKIDVAKSERELENDKILKEIDFQNQLRLEKVKTSGNIEEINARGEAKSTSSSTNGAGGSFPNVVVGETSGAKVDYYGRFQGEIKGLEKENLGLQSSLMKLIAESSDPNVKKVLEKYPDLSTNMYGEKSLKSLIAATGVLSKTSGGRLEKNANLQPIMYILNKIRENSVLLDFKREEFGNNVKALSNDSEKFNKDYVKTGGGSTIFNYEIPLDFINDNVKETRDARNKILPELRVGGIVDKNGKPLDDKDDIKKLENVDWSKSVIGSFNKENMTVEVIPKNEEGKTISIKGGMFSDKEDRIKVKVGQLFVDKLATLPGMRETLQNINKPNTDFDYFIRRNNNSRFVEKLSKQTFFVDREKATALPEGTVLEYRVKNVRNPLENAGQTRSDYLVDVDVMINDRPYSITVNSVSDVNALINNHAVIAKQMAEQFYSASNKQPTKQELEDKTHFYLIERIKRNK